MRTIAGGKITQQWQPKWNNHIDMNPSWRFSMVSKAGHRGELFPLLWRIIQEERLGLSTLSTEKSSIIFKCMVRSVVISRSFLASIR